MFPEGGEDLEGFAGFISDGGLALQVFGHGGLASSFAKASADMLQVFGCGGRFEEECAVEGFYGDAFVFERGFDVGVTLDEIWFVATVPGDGVGACFVDELVEGLLKFFGVDGALNDEGAAEFIELLGEVS